MVEKIGFRNEIELKSSGYSSFLNWKPFIKAKRHELFDPQLPDDKLQAIDTIGFGIVDKIYLEFSEPVFNSTTYWSFLYDDEGISYSAEDAAKDWTRFLLGSYVIDSRLTSFWLSGNFYAALAALAAFYDQNFYCNSLKSPERILQSSDFGNNNSLLLSTDKKKSSEFLNNSCSKKEDFRILQGFL